MGVTRRSALKRIGLVLGIGGVAATGIGLSPSGSDETFTLQGRGWHAYGRGLAKGRLPAEGDRLVSYGQLYRDGEEAAAGEFAATYFSLPQQASEGRLASLEQHVFKLSDGSIFGSGMTAPGLETLDEFAIVGGTGRYAGARGTYVVQQRHLEFGGDGTAVITFQLMSEATS